MTGDFEWLQEWYAGRCDGDWEHAFGISIDTLDNPGWSLSIDLSGSALAGRGIVDRVAVDRTPTDWYSWEVREDKFLAAGGPKNLSELVRLFRHWVETTVQ